MGLLAEKRRFIVGSLFHQVENLKCTKRSQKVISDKTHRVIKYSSECTYQSGSKTQLGYYISNLKKQTKNVVIGVGLKLVNSYFAHNSIIIRVSDTFLTRANGAHRVILRNLH